MKKLLSLVLALVALAVVLDTSAEVITKGGAMNLRPLNRETANFSYTNGVANPGLPLLFRVTSFQGTNHFGITTNAQLVTVGLGTNYVGFTGVVPNPTNTMYFRNGLLVTTNGFQSP